MNASALDVWLVDDDASIRWVLERALRDGGMTPRAFDAAEPVLDALKRESPDVLVTDLRMPGLDGIELLRRAREAAPELIVVLVTAFADVETAVRAMQEGAEHYLTKPIQIEELVLVIRRALERRQRCDVVRAIEIGVAVGHARHLVTRVRLCRKHPGKRGER